MYCNQITSGDTASVVLYLQHDQLNTVYCTTHTKDKEGKRRCSHFLQGSGRKSPLRRATNCTDSNQDMVSFYRQSINDEFPEDDEASKNKQYTESIHTVSTVCSHCQFKLSMPMVNEKKMKIKIYYFWKVTVGWLWISVSCWTTFKGIQESERRSLTLHLRAALWHYPSDPAAVTQRGYTETPAEEKHPGYSTARSRAWMSTDGINKCLHRKTNNKQHYFNFTLLKTEICWFIISQNLQNL